MSEFWRRFQSLRLRSDALCLRKLAIGFAPRERFGDVVSKLTVLAAERVIVDPSLVEAARGLSANSICVGVAQDHITAGEGLPAIMQTYLWRDPNGARILPRTRPR